MTLNISVHKNILLQVLKDMYTDVTIGPVLGFKGGTAAYLFYGLSRFSVDLDFDLLDRQKGGQIHEKLTRLVGTYGKVRESRQKNNALIMILSYNDKAQNIKIEVNLRDFGSRYEVKSYLGISMNVMVQEDMFANKLVAMHERIGRSNRDIFDAWFFLKHNWPLNERIVETRTGLAFKKFVAINIASLEKFPDRGILSGIGELLDAKQKAWAKANLRKDTIFLLQLLIEK